MRLRPFNWNYYASAFLICSLLLTMPACPKFSSASDIEKAENKINQSSNALNALAKTNRELYRQNVINLENRKMVATAIGKAASGLDKVADRVFEIDLKDPGSISLGKIDVVKLLRTVGEHLNEINIGNEEIRIAVQAIIFMVNESIALVQQIKEIR